MGGRHHTLLAACPRGRPVLRRRDAPPVRSPIRVRRRTALSGGPTMSQGRHDHHGARAGRAASHDDQRRHGQRGPRHPGHANDRQNGHLRPATPLVRGAIGSNRQGEQAGLVAVHGPPPGSRNRDKATGRRGQWTRVRFTSGWYSGSGPSSVDGDHPRRWTSGRTPPRSAGTETARG